MSTNLLLFFLLLYALELMDVETRRDIHDSFRKQFGSATEVSERRAVEEKELEALEAALSEEGIRRFAKVERDARVTRVTMREPVLFDSARADLKKESKHILNQIAKPYIGTSHRIVVEGHTDNIPISTARFPSNWELSAARAFSIIEHFREAGIEPERMSANAYSDIIPVESNETPEGRAANRRIEIKIIRKS